MATVGKRRVQGEKSQKPVVRKPREGYHLAGLARVRIDRWLKQQELADLAGVSRPMVSMYETGVRRASPRLMHKLAEALQVDPQELLMDESLAERELKRYEEEKESA